MTNSDIPHFSTAHLQYSFIHGMLFLCPPTIFIHSFHFISFIHSFIHSFIILSFIHHSFIHSFIILSLIHSPFFHSFIHHLFIHLFIILSFIHSFPPRRDLTELLERVDEEGEKEEEQDLDNRLQTFQVQHSFISINSHHHMDLFNQQPCECFQKRSVRTFSQMPSSILII